MNKIFDEFKMVKPTTLSAAPRFYDSIHSQYQAALSEAKELYPTASPEELEQQVLEQCRQLLGGDIQWLVIGGAASSAVVKDFMVRCFKCKVFDGYGTTEAGGISTDDALYPNVEVKLLDVPDMGYTTEDKPWPRGEIVVRTPQMIDGYYKDEEATKANFEDGWFRTGDIGEMYEGRLRIIDRKKNLFKLVQGVFVAPSNIENILLKCPFVDQIFVYGGSSFGHLKRFFRAFKFFSILTRSPPYF
jgi:long-subunit acyl-CoA synthetase (AMP-forming)